MEAACLFAQRLQVEQIIAVSNETQYLPQPALSR
ncbi:Uncharacterised protein [Escherichia coli]|uniref:Uncharacterized protein n=1 Tax=Escherichia coli TaxID=562 RepID=A0A376RLH5_ECOLX|nr:Uncharacterised protein [Escherichia coli]